VRSALKTTDTGVTNPQTLPSFSVLSRTHEKNRRRRTAKSENDDGSIIFFLHPLFFADFSLLLPSPSFSDLFEIERKVPGNVTFAVEGKTSREKKKILSKDKEEKFKVDRNDESNGFAKRQQGVRGELEPRADTRRGSVRRVSQ
jgi:hypothetical protein